MQPSLIHSSLGPRQVRPFTFDSADVEAIMPDLYKFGITMDSADLMLMAERYHAEVNAGVSTMDAIQGLITTASINTPVQFLQNWLPGFVDIITAARQIDDLVGISIIGNWEDEEVVQGVMEVTGTSVPYGDYTNVPLASWNVNFEKRTVVRFEDGVKVGRLEEMRASRMRVSSADSKRRGSSESLEIQRNGIGFYGYNNGANKTYGFLNDPSLPAYVPVANNAGATSTQWTAKTFLEICADIRTAFVALRTQSKSRIDPNKMPITLAISANRVDYLSVSSDFGITVADWIKQSYPKTRVESAPELNGANGGANVFYAYAEVVDNTGTDDSRTFMQVVPTKFMVVGVANTTKGYEEDYSNATAGIMLKRPYAVVRYTGI